MKYLLLIIFLISIILSCSDDRVKPEIDSSINSDELPAQESWNSKIIFSDSGKTKAILYAGHLRSFTDSKLVLLDSNVQVDFYDENEIKTSTLTSKRGKVDETTNNLWAMDSVVTLNDSIKITTEEMMWRNADQKIISDKFVRLVSPTEKIEGYGFESDQSLSNYVIYRITYITTNNDTL